MDRYKTHIVFFKSSDEKIRFDMFEAKTRSEAIHDYKECYRHGLGEIISVLTVEELCGKYAEMLNAVSK